MNRGAKPMWEGTQKDSLGVFYFFLYMGLRLCNIFLFHNLCMCLAIESWGKKVFTYPRETLTPWESRFSKLRVHISNNHFYDYFNILYDTFCIPMDTFYPYIPQHSKGRRAAYPTGLMALASLVQFQLLD